MFIPVYRGEFGLKVRFHVPMIYALGRGHTIEIEQGEEALYPLADEWVVVPRDQKDKDRHGDPPTRYQRMAEVRFVPDSYKKQEVPFTDVVICPRKRDYVKAKNWTEWLTLVRTLQGIGLNVSAAGVKDSSETDLPLDCAAWDFARPLDASIDLIRSAALVIAPCSGLAHLAVLCGAPLLLLTYRGLTSPGPVYSSSGRFVSKHGRPVPLAHYYHEANHRSSLIETVDGWEDPLKVAERTYELIRRGTRPTPRHMAIADRTRPT